MGESCQILAHLFLILLTNMCIQFSESHLLKKKKPSHKNGNENTRCMLSFRKKKSRSNYTNTFLKSKQFLSFFLKLVLVSCVQLTEMLKNISTYLYSSFFLFNYCRMKGIIYCPVENSLLQRELER